MCKGYRARVILLTVTFNLTWTRELQNKTPHSDLVPDLHLFFRFKTLPVTITGAYMRMSQRHTNVHVCMLICTHCDWCRLPRSTNESWQSKSITIKKKKNQCFTVGFMQRNLSKSPATACYYCSTPHTYFYTTSSKWIELKRRKNRRQINVVRSKLVIMRK